MSDLFEPDRDNGAPENQRQRRWPRWLALLLGLALGLTAGLGYAWGLNPVQFYNTDPVDLRPEHKETWTLLVAATYRQDGDLDQALYRLAGLDDPQIGRTVAELTERYIQEGKSATRIRALAALSDALGARSDAMMIYLATPEPTLFFTPTPPPPTPTASATETPVAPLSTDTPAPSPSPTLTPTPTRTPSLTPTVRPTATRRPTPTSLPPYVLQERKRVCPSVGDTPRIEIVVQTQEGAGIPGVEIWISGAGGAERFYTGLKPEIGLGYADFDLTADVFYTIAVGDPNRPLVTNLSAELCRPGEAGSPLASWQLTVVANLSAFTPTPSPTPTPVSLTPLSPVSTRTPSDTLAAP